MFHVLYEEPQPPAPGEIVGKETLFAVARTLFDAKMIVWDAILGRYAEHGVPHEGTQWTDYWLRDPRTGKIEQAVKAIERLNPDVRRAAVASLAYPHVHIPGTPMDSPPAPLSPAPEMRMPAESKYSDVEPHEAFEDMPF